MAFKVQTIRSQNRYYLIEVDLKDPHVLISGNQIKQIIRYNYEKLFGQAELATLALEINDQGPNTYILTTNCKDAISLRTALSLPTPASSNIRSIHVLSESSFIQPLFHNSRLYFQPLP